MYNIKYTREFGRKVKDIVKKNPSFVDDLKEFVKEQEKSFSPDPKDRVYKNTYKIRIAISGQNKGKSGGARILIYALSNKKELVFLSIFPKSELDNVSDDYIKSIIKEFEDGLTK